MNEWWQATFPKGRQYLPIIDANGQSVNIAYGEKGQGQPLLLLHGVASWSYSWRQNVDALAEHFRVICIDAKGCGFSDKPMLLEQSGHQVIELVRVVESLCDRPVAVAAESLGALTTLGAVQSHPHLFERLILINVPIFPRQLPSWGMRLLAQFPLSWIRQVDQWQLAQLFAPLILTIVKVARSEVVVDPAAVTHEEIYGITYPQIYIPGTITKLAEDLQLAAREIERLERGEPNLISEIQSRLSAVTCPALVLWADQDRWFPVEHGQELHRRLPNAQFQILPNCGHYAIGGQPELINQAIRSFLWDQLDLDKGAIAQSA